MKMYVKYYTTPRDCRVTHLKQRAMLRTLKKDSDNLLTSVLALSIN